MRLLVRRFSFNLRYDVLVERLRVTAIEPGLTGRGFFEVRFRGDEEQARLPHEGVQPSAAD